MKSASDLKKILRRIDGRGYKAYKEVEGSYDFREYQLEIDHVQADPFASASRMRVRIDQQKAGFPQETYNPRSREIALRDFLARCFYQAIGKFSRGKRGTGKSGLIFIPQPGQEILERSSCLVNSFYVEMRLAVGLPAWGRRIAARVAEAMFFEELPQIVGHSLYFQNLDKQQLEKHIETAEDADFLRHKLDELGLVAFVADGAILPRASGIDPRPLSHGPIVPFQSPDSMRVTLDLPHRGRISGLGLKKGVTLIVGGGYHGKSTLLQALEMGIYNHIPGDGRELVVSNPWAVKIRAEDGRRIEKVDISPFISNLPFKRETKAFSTDDASGSTSQAANTIEALELGAQVLLIDEDTSATNFMIRDHRMQELVSKEKEPITPFIDKIRLLYSDYGVSTILVIGGSGDYFDVADWVICMLKYKPYDLTQEAKAIAEKYKAERQPEGGHSFGRITERIPLASSFDAKKGRKEVKIKTVALKSILFGRYLIDLSSVEQLVDEAQTKAIAEAIYYARRLMNERKTLKEIINSVLENISQKGLDILSTWPHGKYASFRGLELGAAINRLRSLRVRQKE
ncbi:MAG: ABC-ATPase domain-containing protein [Candidatus Aminicenantales bacterium]